MRITKKMIEETPFCDAVYTINKVLKEAENGTTIELEKAVYDIRRTYAMEKYCFISNNDSGLKNIAFGLFDKQDITINGNGAHLNCIGRVLPFYLEGCKNITIKNFTVDYMRPFMSQGEVLESAQNYAVLKIDKSEFPYEVNNGIFKFIGEDYESEHMHGMLEYTAEKRPVPDAFDNSVRTAIHGEEISDGIVRIDYDFRLVPRVGNILTLKHENRLVPAITLDRCEDTMLENIWIKQAGTMGVVAQFCHNVHINKVDIYPDPSSQRVFSINADGTHFVNCSGNVIVENGKYESMLDDLINVHGNYMRVDTVVDSKTLIIEQPHHQQEGCITAKEGLSGLKIEICDKETMLPIAINNIVTDRAINKKYRRIELSESYEFSPDKQYTIDLVDIYPTVVFRNNTGGKNRARGLILTSKKETLVEGNTLDTEGSAIKVNSDMSNWYESANISKLTIRNNRLTRKNHSNWGEALIDIDPHPEKQIQGQYYHGDMIIENNELILEKSPLFYGYNFRSVAISGNKILLADGVSDSADFLVQASECGEVVFSDNSKQVL